MSRPRTESEEGAGERRKGQSGDRAIQFSGRHDSDGGAIDQQGAGVVEETFTLQNDQHAVWRP